MALLMSSQTCYIFVFRLAFHLTQLSHSHPFMEVEAHVISGLSLHWPKKNSTHDFPESRLGDLKNGHMKSDKNLTSRSVTSTVPEHL